MARRPSPSARYATPREDGGRARACVRLWFVCVCVTQHMCVQVAQVQVVELLDHYLKATTSTDITRAYVLTALVKLSTRLTDATALQ